MVALYAPIWAMRMVGEGDALPAICLIIGTAGCVYGFIQGCVRESKWIAYASMMALIVIATWINGAGY